MIWAIDVGNSRVVSGWMEQLRVLKHHEFETATLRRPAGALKWARELKRRGNAGSLVVSSVVPPVDRGIRRTLRLVFGVEPAFVDPTSKNMGIPIRYKRPREVGADRIVNSLAARHLYGAPVIVVDYGTGTTFDVIDRQGAYRGGVIVPGIGMSLKAMHDQTAKLPLVKYAKVRRAIGQTTAEAMRSGIYYGTIGETREILQRIREELGARAPALATGGWCHIFKNTGLFHRIEPDITLIGMALWARRNHA